MAALDSNFLDDVELDRELEACRADVARFTAASRRPWNEQQGTKVRAQLKVARIHLARLERLRSAA